MVLRLCNGSCTCVDEDDLEFAQATSCHGLKRFCNSWHTVRRVFWLFITFLSLGLLGQQMADRFFNFLKFELKTEISVTAVKSLPLPTVTLCNLNMFSKSLLTPMDRELLANVSVALSKSVNQHYVSFSPEDDRIANWSSDAYWQSVKKYEKYEEQILAKYGETAFTVDKWITRAGWQLRQPGKNESALLSCRVGRMSCTIENFRPILTPQGLCYSLNWKQAPRFHQKMPGGEAGINILLDINQDEYTHFNLNGESQYECGSKVVISDWYDYVDLGLAVGISPGYLGYVSARTIRRTTVNHPPWGTCEAGPTANNGGVPYSTRQCHVECTSRHSITACGCRLWYEPIIEGFYAPVCGVAKTTACLILKSLPQEEDAEEHCMKSCVDACNTTSYAIAASYTLMTSNNTISAFVEYLRAITGLIYSEAKVLRNILQIQVAYPELIVETMSTTQAQTISGFLSDLGGQLGLFAGISVITVIELIEYPFLKIFLLFQKRRRCHSESQAITKSPKHRQRSNSIMTAASGKKQRASVGTPQHIAAVYHRTGEKISNNTVFVAAHPQPRITEPTTGGAAFMITPSKTFIEMHDCKLKYLNNADQ